MSSKKQQPVTTAAAVPEENVDMDSDEDQEQQ